MNSLRRIEHYMAEYASLAKLLVVLLWVLWAGQLGSPILKSIELEKKYYRNNVVHEIKRKAQWEYAEHAVAIIEQAKVLNKQYTPEQYFADRRSIDEKKYAVEKRYEVRVQDVSTIEIEDIIRRNTEYNRLAHERLVQAAADYGDWVRGGSGTREREHEKMRLLTGNQVFGWALQLLLRGMLLALLLYLVRMSERKGIAQTIASGKRAFFRAVLFWPMYVWKYPFNIIREIRLEAELRRLGNVFRKLSNAEKLMVLSVANSDGYNHWLNAYRKQYQHSFRRSLLIALIPAILLYAMPSLTHAADIIESGVCVQAVQLEHQCNKAPPIEIPTTLEGVDTFWFKEPPLILIARLFESRERIPRGVPREIDHVPLCCVLCV